MPTKKLQILNSLVSHSKLTDLDAANQHPIDAITNLRSELGQFEKTTEVDAKLLTRAESQHKHVITEIDELSDKLDGMALLDHEHDILDITDLSTQLLGKAESKHGHQISDIATLETELDGKALLKHGHTILDISDIGDASVSYATSANVANTANAVAWGNVSDKPATFEPAGHKHIVNDITDLQTSLNSKVPTTRKINNKELNADISLTYSDVGAAQSQHQHIQDDVEGLSDVLDEVTEIANGKCGCTVFDTLEEMTAWTGISDNTTNLKVGHVFLIRYVGVPDYWWDGSSAQVLETTKVDLSEYSKTDHDHKYAGSSSSGGAANSANAININGTAYTLKTTSTDTGGTTGCITFVLGG